MIYLCALLVLLVLLVLVILLQGDAIAEPVGGGPPPLQLSSSHYPNDTCSAKIPRHHALRRGQFHLLSIYIEFLAKYISPSIDVGINVSKAKNTKMSKTDHSGTLGSRFIDKKSNH